MKNGESSVKKTKVKFDESKNSIKEFAKSEKIQNLGPVKEKSEEPKKFEIDDQKKGKKNKKNRTKGKKNKALENQKKEQDSLPKTEGEIEEEKANEVQSEKEPETTKPAEQPKKEQKSMAEI